MVGDNFLQIVIDVCCTFSNGVKEIEAMLSMIKFQVSRHISSTLVYFNKMILGRDVS